MRNKNWILECLFPLLPSFLAQLLSQILYLLPLSGSGRWRMGVAISSSHIVCAAPSSSGGGLLTLFYCCNVGTLPQETVLHELLQRESFPQAAVLHKLLWHGSLHGVQSFRNRLLQNRLVHCDPWDHNSCQQTCSGTGSPLSMGPQVLPGVCYSMGFPLGHSLLWVHPLALVWGHPGAAGGYLFHHGPPWTAGQQPASPRSSPWAAGESLLRQVQRLPILLLHWPWCLQNFFTHIVSLSTGVPQQVFPLLKYVTTVADGLGLGQQLVHLGASWHWFYWTCGKLLTEAAPVAPLLPRPCHANPVQILIFILYFTIFFNCINS